MYQKNFSLSDLGLLSGGVNEEVFRRQLKRLVEDCEDRPAETKARVLKITVSMVPETRQDGALTDVSMVVNFHGTIPKHEGFPTTCRILHGGDLAYNDLAADNPDQMTIDEVDR